MKKEILIFGAGKYGKHAYLNYSSLYRVVGFIDNNLSLTEKTIFGIPVFSPDVLESETYRNIRIIIANYGHYKEIQKQLFYEYGISDTILFQIRTDEKFVRFSDDLADSKNIEQGFILEYKGGLGNQMFQYVFYKWLQKQGFHVEADLSGYYLLRGRPYCLNHIFKKVELKECNYQRLEKLKEEQKIYNEKTDKLFDLKQDQNMILSGYWQHYVYANEIRDELKDYFSFQVPRDLKMAGLLEQISRENSVSVHVRRGDYLQKENVDIFGDICTDEYYRNSLRYIEEKVINPKFYVFCNDINWTKEHMKLQDAVYIDKNRFKKYEDWFDLFLMAQCKHNIIANSSFSWWGAWLNRNSSKIVIAPRKWRNDMVLHNICPKEWIRI